MLIWIALALMTAAVVAAVTRPLLRAPASAPATDPDATSIYRDQIQEIDRDLQRGVLDLAEAEAARTEIARRLLEADDARSLATPGDPSHNPASLDRRAALAMMALLPVAAVVIYAWTGSPELPGQPLSARLSAPSQTADVADLVRKVEARLQQHPEDGQGWDVIAPVYFKQGRYREAADAFQRASRILGENARRLAGFAESTVVVNDGIVTEPARIAYEKLAKLEPERIEPRFWLTLAKEQDGMLDAAIADYEAMLRTAPPDASWRPLVTERLDEARTKLGKPRSPSPAQPPSAKGPAPPGPTADDIAAAQRMPSSDRKAMIEGMVDGLAQRLKVDGRDLAGWERLIRAYAIMGRKADAIAALGDARRNFKDEAQPLAQLTELAKSLGLDT